MTTLARLSFWVPATQQDHFADTFEHTLLPLLANHRLTDPSVPERPAMPGVFSRLFTVESPAAVTAIGQALHADQTWCATLRASGATHHQTYANGLLELYRAPLGPGTVIADSPSYRQGLWQIFSLENSPTLGMPSIALHQTQDALWLGTYEGLARFDGGQFRLHNHNSGLGDIGWVSGLASDASGVLWVGGQTLAHIDRGNCVHYGPADGLTLPVQALLLDQTVGHLWVGTASGLYLFDSQAGHKGPLDGQSITAVEQDLQGLIWAGTDQGALYPMADRTAQPVSVTRDAPLPPIHDLAADHQGHLWIGTEEGLYCFDGRQTTRFAPDPKSPNGRVSGPQGAAQLLGINAHTLSSRIRKYGLSKNAGLE
jgi:hypothetical protein